MPTGMSKRLGNTSKFVKSSQRIMWKIQLIFAMSKYFNPSMIFSQKLETNIPGTLAVSEDQCLVGITVDSIDETVTVDELIIKFMEHNEVLYLQ